MELYESSSHTDAVVGRCSVCGDPIAPARLKIIPDATECVTCKEQLGDEPMIRRYDEYFGKEVEDFVSITFTRPNQYVRSAIGRLMNPANYYTGASAEA